METRGAIRIEARLYATLARVRPSHSSGERLTLEIAQGTTIRQVLEGEIGISPHEVKMVFVNGLARDFDYPLADGDRVGIFPPIGGG
jgi:molybdopterin converting factor small subunit